jgi:hypothetical protein
MAIRGIDSEIAVRQCAFNLIFFECLPQTERSRNPARAENIPRAHYEYAEGVSRARGRALHYSGRNTRYDTASIHEAGPSDV